MFALGTTGGPLLVGLLFGHLGHIGPIDLTLKNRRLNLPRTRAYRSFSSARARRAGAGFVETLRQEGAMSLSTAIMTLLPMIVGYFVAAKCLKLALLN